MANLTTSVKRARAKLSGVIDDLDRLVGDSVKPAPGSESLGQVDGQQSHAPGDGDGDEAESEALTPKEKAAARQAAYRARKGSQVALQLPVEVVEALDAYIARRAADRDTLTRSQVVEELIRKQLMRKR